MTYCHAASGSVSGRARRRLRSERVNLHSEGRGDVLIAALMTNSSRRSALPLPPPVIEVEDATGLGPALVRQKTKSRLRRHYPPLGGGPGCCTRLPQAIAAFSAAFST